MRAAYYSILNKTLARIVRTPPYLILFVSGRCPNNCRHCWYNNGWKSANLMGKELTNDELIRISENLRSVGFLSLTGGEAFLRDGIEEIIEAFNKNTKVGRFDIPTSGFDPDLIAAKTCRILKFLGGKPFRIDISVDGTGSTHNHIRRNNNSYSNALKTIEALKKLKLGHPNLDISIITTISEHNYKEIESLSNLVESILPQGEWMINIARGNDTKTIVGKEVINAYKLAGELVAKRISHGRFAGDKGHKTGKLLTAKNIVRRKVISEILDNKRKGGGCAAGSLAGVIFNDGDVRPCETLDISFGNLRDYEYNLEKIWIDGKASDGRKMIQRSEERRVGKECRSWWST